MAGAAPLDPQSPARRLLLRALTLPLPLPLPLPSRTPTPAPDSAAADATFATIELDLLEPLHQPNSEFRRDPPHQLRRRQTVAATTTTAAVTAQEEDAIRLPWPVQNIGASSPSRHRRSISSCFSDISSLSSLSEAEPRATPARPKAPRIKSREAESEAIWRELWI